MSFSKKISRGTFLWKWVLKGKVSFRSERLFCQFQVWWWALCVPLNPWTSGPSEVLSELVFTSFCSHPYSQISTKLKRARKYTFAKREKTERTKGLLNFRWYGKSLKISSKWLQKRNIVCNRKFRLYSFDFIFFIIYSLWNLLREFLYQW